MFNTYWEKVTDHEGQSECLVYSTWKMSHKGNRVSHLFSSFLMSLLVSSTHVFMEGICVRDRLPAYFSMSLFFHSIFFLFFPVNVFTTEVKYLPSSPFIIFRTFFFSFHFILQYHQHTGRKGMACLWLQSQNDSHTVRQRKRMRWLKKQEKGGIRKEETIHNTSKKVREREKDTQTDEVKGRRVRERDST